MVRYENVKQIKFNFDNGLEVFADINSSAICGKYDVYFYINLKGLYIKYFVFDKEFEATDKTIKKTISDFVNSQYDDDKFDKYVTDYRSFIVEVCDLVEEEENGR